MDQRQAGLTRKIVAVPEQPARGAGAGTGDSSGSGREGHWCVHDGLVFDGGQASESVAGTATVTNTWTPNGALATSTTPAGTQTYTTDLTDELISLQLAGGSTVGYTHDAQGNHTSRTVDGLLDASWAWDDLSSLPMRIGEYDAAGTLATAWLADPTSSTGASLAQTSAGVSSWLLSDPFANTVATVSTTGNTVSGTRTMDAFGVQRTAATGSLANAAVGFAGQYLDDATGLYDMRARDYDPSSGRFTATDPVDVSTGTPYFAGYSYSYNNPLMYSDASGLTACGPIGSDCNGANLVPEFDRLDRALNDTAFLNLYQSLTAEQISEIGFDDMSIIHSEAMDRQLHQMACEGSPGECLPPCPEQDYDRCQLERGALGFVAYFALPMLLGAGASALLGRACAADAFASLAARTTTAEPSLSFSQKILGQMGPRGWSQELIEQTVKSPAAKHSVWDFTTGAKQAATAYARSDGSYVVVNDSTGAIVQVSDIGNAGWKPVWNDPRFQR